MTKKLTEAEKRGHVRLTMIVDYDKSTFTMEDAQELVEMAKGHGHVVKAHLENLPTEVDL